MHVKLRANIGIFCEISKYLPEKMKLLLITQLFVDNFMPKQAELAASDARNEWVVVA